MLGIALALALFNCAEAQFASAPGEAKVPPGIPPDERIDLTGDGIADVVITGRTDLIPDPEQGLEGWYRRLVRTLPGTSILVQGTPNNYGYYLLAEGASLDTAALAKGFHFKQLQWAQSEPTEFHVLEQPFGPGITPAQMGWYGSGEQYEGSFVLRSTMGDRPAIAAFRILFNIPAGRIWVEPYGSLPVHARFGSEGDPPPPPPKEEDAYSFGHEVEPQVIIPAGLPPDEPVDLDFDQTPDAIITGHEEHWHPGSSPGQALTDRMGYYVRGVSPAPGAAFLMQRIHGVSEIFRLGEVEALTPEQLSGGLQNGTLYWSTPEMGKVFCAVLRHPFGMPDEPQEWTAVEEEFKGNPVYRTISYTEVHIGVVVLRGEVPGGELSVEEQQWVLEGQVLQMR